MAARKNKIKNRFLLKKKKKPNTHMKSKHIYDECTKLKINNQSEWLYLKIHIHKSCGSYGSFKWVKVLKYTYFCLL